MLTVPLAKGQDLPPGRGVLGMTKLHVMVLGSVEYPIITISPRSTLTWNGSAYYDQIDLFKNYLYLIDSPISKHKIILNGLTCHQNQS